MITKKELQTYALTKGLTLGNAEKDYLLDIALFSIGLHTKNELALKGGTCLYKFHKLNRFSEDLDFSATSALHVPDFITAVLSDFARFGITATLHHQHEPHRSVLLTLRITGPLFTGNPMTYASIGIDINFASPVVLEPEFLTYSSGYPDLAQISAICMRQEEIFAEKIRALLTRERARDLFDLHYLLENNIHASSDLIAKKMEYYHELFDLDTLLLRIKALEKHWKKELLGFTSPLPDFSVVSEHVISKLQARYSKNKLLRS